MTSRQLYELLIGVADDVGSIGAVSYEEFCVANSISDASDVARVEHVKQDYLLNSIDPGILVGLYKDAMPDVIQLMTMVNTEVVEVSSPTIVTLDGNIVGDESDYCGLDSLISFEGPEVLLQSFIPAFFSDVHIVDFFLKYFHEDVRGEVATRSLVTYCENRTENIVWVMLDNRHPYWTVSNGGDSRMSSMIVGGDTNRVVARYIEVSEYLAAWDSNRSKIRIGRAIGMLEKLSSHYGNGSTTLLNAISELKGRLDGRKLR